MKHETGLFAKATAALAFLIFAQAAVGAEQVKKLDFTGVTKTEQVVITINDNEQTMEYLTPSRASKYTILDYDVSSDPTSGNKIVTATAVDQLFNTAYEVLLYANESFSDIRIGKKRVTFTYVRDFRIEPR